MVKVELTVGPMGERKGERGAEPPGSALEGYVACTKCGGSLSQSIIIAIQRKPSNSCPPSLSVQRCSVS